jgi:dolichyl-diphosphooligosaccharide--protein glycosyltransferase
MRFGVQELSKRFKALPTSLLIYSTLAAIVVFFIGIRMLPLQWGVYLNDFDPYVYYKSALYIVQHGYAAYYQWFDPTRWAPWGTNPISSLGIGVPFTGAAVYLFLNFIGVYSVSVLDVAVFLPVVFGAICVLLVYGIGTILVNRGVGLLAAFVFTVDPTSIERTGLGWFTTELGIIGLFAAIFFFLKAQKSKTIPYSILAGLGLSYMAISWGAYLYPLNLLALYLIVMVLLGKWTNNLSVSYMITVSLTLFTIALTPDMGVSAVFSVPTVLPLIAALVCFIQSLTQYITNQVKRRNVTIASVFGSIIVLVALAIAGIFGSVASKFWLILNPLSRAAIVGTVGEQFPSIWYNYFANYHVLIILAPVGAYFAIKRFSRRDIFLVLLTIAAIYGAGSQVRLMIIVAPFTAMLAGVALTSIFTNFREIWKHHGPEKKGRSSLLTRGYGILVLAIVFVALVPVAYDNVAAANAPPMIITSSTGYVDNLPDWSQTLSWLHDNIPADATVGCWWDYGYWINVVANKTVVVDNSTTNGTQIKLVADAFLGNESNSLSIFQQMNVSYVVVYEPFLYVNLGNSTNPVVVGIPPWSQEGDFEKSTAMMAIAGYNVSGYIQSTQITVGGETLGWPLPGGQNASSCLLYELLFYPFAADYQNYFGITIGTPQHYSLVYESPADGWVLVYKINYPSN